MPDPVALPAMLAPQQQAWHALMDLYDRISTGWTLIGGQLVHLHCAERGISPTRPTLDIDTVVDVRARQDMLATFTGALIDLGFSADTSGTGVQHRWTRDQAQVDVLIPEGVGDRARGRHGAAGGPTVPAPGSTQALARTEPVSVEVGARIGTVLRPTLIGALIAKAAARTEIINDRAKARHCGDFVVLAHLVAARDFRGVDLSRKDRQRLRRMVTLCRGDETAMGVEHANEALDRLERAAKLSG